MSTASPTTDDIARVHDRAPNVARMFLDRVTATPAGEAYRFPEADGAGETWHSRTWSETSDEVHRVAAGLVALGVEPGQRVAIASSTRFEWILADLAIMCSGGATTTVYPSTMAADVAFILSDSDSVVVFAEDDDQVAKLREEREQLPALTRMVTFDGTPDPTNHDGELGWVITLQQLEELGREYLVENPAIIEQRVEAIEPDSLATLIYTSGTTGKPKGVRLRHSGWTYEGEAVAATGILSVDDLQYLWLPMAHSFGKVLLTAQLAIGFPTAVDGRVDKIVENLAVVQPTLMGAAPRIFEKAYGRIVTMAHNEGGVKAKIFDWAGRRGAEGVAGAAGGPAGVTAARRAAQGRRHAGVLEGAGALRRPGAVLHLRLGGAVVRRRGVVPRRRHPHPRGLRADRDLGGLERQPAGQLPVRHRRAAVRRAPSSGSPTTARS